MNLNFNFWKSVTSKADRRFEIKSISNKAIPYFGFVFLTMGNSMAKPPNDLWENSIGIFGNSVSVIGDVTGAGFEIGEKNHWPGNPPRSIWYHWVAPDSGVVEISTEGSVADTVVAAYSGDTLKSLEPLVRDYNSNPDRSSFIVFPVNRGQRFSIAIDTRSNEGLVYLHLNFFAQKNFSVQVGFDNWPNPKIENSHKFIALGNNLTATHQFSKGEPFHWGDTIYQSLWWTWKAPSTGEVSIDIASTNFAPVLAVYTGNEINRLDSVVRYHYDYNPDASGVNFQCKAGEVYYIAIDTTSVGGNVQFILELVENSLPSGVTGVDDFFARQSLSFPLGIGVGNTISATRQPGEPVHEETFNGSIWWRWFAENTGRVEISTFGSNFNTVVSVYKGSSLESLSRVAGNDDQGQFQTSRLFFQAEKGVEYSIAVSSRDWGGNLNLKMIFEGDPLTGIYIKPVPAAEISFFGQKGKTYQLQSSGDLLNWYNEGSPMIGSSAVLKTIIPASPLGREYFRFIILQ